MPEPFQPDTRPEQHQSPAAPAHQVAPAVARGSQKAARSTGRTQVQRRRREEGTRKEGEIPGVRPERGDNAGREEGSKTSCHRQRCGACGTSDVAPHPVQTHGRALRGRQEQGCPGQAGALQDLHCAGGQGRQQAGRCRTAESGQTGRKQLERQ